MHNQYYPFTSGPRFVGFVLSLAAMDHLVSLAESRDADPWAHAAVPGEPPEGCEWHLPRPGKVGPIARGIRADMARAVEELLPSVTACASGPMLRIGAWQEMRLDRIRSAVAQAADLWREIHRPLAVVPRAIWSPA